VIHVQLEKYFYKQVVRIAAHSVEIAHDVAFVVCKICQTVNQTDNEIDKYSQSYCEGSSSETADNDSNDYDLEISMYLNITALFSGKKVVSNH
jgi:transcription elongation factor Elf1